MGCFSSKMVCRTASFRGCTYIHSGRTLEDLLSSKTGGDPLLALLYTGNTVVMKLKPQQEKERVSFSQDKSNCTENKLAECEDPADVADDVVNAWELMAGLDEDERDDDVGSDNDYEQQECQQEEHPERKRSPYGLRITCERFSDDGRLVQIEEIHVDDFLSCSSDEGKEDDHDQLDVYEEVVVEKRSGQSRSQGHRHEAMESSVCADLDAVNAIDLDCDCDSLLQFTVSGGQFQCPRRTSNLSKAKSYTINATGEELRGLRIPSFRFRSVGDVRGKTTEDAGEEESVSGYATPKFGCYLELETVSGNLQDELVARLEEAMKQLAVDEEGVLMTVVEEFLEQVQEDG